MAAETSPIAAVRDSDMFSIDIFDHRLEVELHQRGLARRLGSLPASQPAAETGYLKGYRDGVSAACFRAVLARVGEFPLVLHYNGIS